MPAADAPRENHDQRPRDDWQRIDAERAERDAARRQWDAEHDPSEAFEAAARPLGPDYGTDRPTERTPEEMQEIRSEFGLTDDQIRRLRTKMFNEIERRHERWES